MSRKEVLYWRVAFASVETTFVPLAACLLVVRKAYSDVISIVIWMIVMQLIPMMR